MRKVKVSKDLGGYRIICGTVFSLNWQRGFTFADTFNTLVHRLEACAMVPIRAHQKHWSGRVSMSLYSPVWPGGDGKMFQTVSDIVIFLFSGIYTQNSLAYH